MNKKENKEKKDREIVEKNDFVELKYTGYVQGKIFDSNIEEDLREITDKAKPVETVVVVGKGMLVPGLDKAIEGKEIGKTYEIDIPYKEAFGERKKELVKIISLSTFTDKNINPRPGMMLALDNALVKILSVSGARVTVDFNNPLAGKDLEYKFIIVRKVLEIDKKAKALFEVLFRFVPEFEVNDKIIIKGPKPFENIAKIYSKKFKEMVGKELGFELEEKLKSSKEKVAYL